MGYTVRVEGLEKLERLAHKYPDIARDEMRKGMEQSVKLVQANVRPLTPVGVSGRLRQSIVTEVNHVGSSIIGKVGSSLTNEIYPNVMEHGRAPGKMPPPKALERWVHLQLGVPNEQALGVAYVVARSIARKGIKGRKFMEQGWEQSKSQVATFFNEALKRIMGRLHGS